MLSTRFAHKVRAGPKLSPALTGVTSLGSILPDVGISDSDPLSPCWFWLVEGISEWGLGVLCFAEKETFCDALFLA
jgi:hypothetical protein